MSSTTPATASNPASTSTTLGILSVVAAGASILLGHTFVLPIAAIVLGFIARSREPQSRVLSTIGIVGGFVILFWWVFVLALGATVFVPFALLHHLY